MALVRISSALIAEVAAGVDTFAAKVFEESVKPVCQEAAEDAIVGGPLSEHLESWFWKEFTQFRGVIPNDWCAEVDFVRGAFPGGEFTMNVLKGDKTAYLLPPGTSRYYPEAVVDETLPWVVDFMERRKAYLKATTAHTEKYESLKRQITAFLHSSKSLNDALKNYPDLRLWIPEEYLDRVNEAATKPKAIKPVAVPAKVDTDFITSLGVLKHFKSS